MSMYTIEDFANRKTNIALHSKDEVEMFLNECRAYGIKWAMGQVANDPMAFGGEFPDYCMLLVNLEGRLRYSRSDSCRVTIDCFDLSSSKMFRIRLPKKPEVLL